MLGLLELDRKGLGLLRCRRCRLLLKQRSDRGRRSYLELHRALDVYAIGFELLQFVSNAPFILRRCLYRQFRILSDRF